MAAPCSRAVAILVNVVFALEAVAPAAAMGNVQFFWWVLLTITFLLPYGLVVAELGTTYDSDGGLYDWVREGLGDTWAARVSWWYWVNFPLWMSSLACMFPSIMSSVWGINMSLPVAILIELAFVWCVTFLAFSPVSEAEWIMNGGAAIKMFITLVIGCVGIWFGVTKGFANDMSLHTFLPDLESIDSLTYLSIILFNFMGFEVIATFASSMQNPQRDIPKALVVGGIAIVAVYIFCSFGISAAIPTEELALDSGIVDAVAAMLGVKAPLTQLVAFVFLVTLFANMTSWSFGINVVASYGAKQGNMLSPFAIINEKTGMPNGAAVCTGIVASVVLLLQLVLGKDAEIFWIFFSMNVVFLLMSYIPMFPAFLQLRKHDGARKRVYHAPFEGLLLDVMLTIPAIELVLAIIATIVPLNGTADEMSKLPMLVGVIVLTIVGEVVRIVSKRGRESDYPGIGRGVPSQFDEAPEEAA